MCSCALAPPIADRNLKSNSDRALIEFHWPSVNLKAGILDWTNLASVGVGSIATKTVGKEAAKLYAKKQLNNQILKLTAKATAATTAFDASVFAGADLAIQETERDLGLRTNYDFKRTGLIRSSSSCPWRINSK